MGVSCPAWTTDVLLQSMPGARLECRALRLHMHQLWSVQGGVMSEAMNGFIAGAAVMSALLLLICAIFGR